MTTTPTLDPVQLAEAASQAKVDLVRKAAASQATIRHLAAQLADARAGYDGEYTAVLAAWGTADTTRFGLLDPAKVAEVAPVKRTRPSTARPVKKAVTAQDAPARRATP